MAKRIKATAATVSQQPVSYKGKVVLKLRKGNNVVRTYSTENSGTLLLFSGLARFLIGQFAGQNFLQNQSNYIPNYLGVGYQATTTPTDPTQYKLFNEYDVGTRFQLTKSNPTIEASANTVNITYTATIPYSSVQSRPLTELGLFASDVIGDNSMLARVNIPSQDGGATQGVTLEVGMNLLVEWTIVIQNAV